MKRIVALLCLVSAPLFAAGLHETVSCLGCHDIHYAVGDKSFAVKNEVMRNPRTAEELKGTTAAMCLGCHEIAEYGGAGIRPIHLHTTHPIGVVPNPKIADVPANMLKDGKLDCVSCHEPHPSNPNWMYLRVDAGKEGDQQQKFCVACHSAKGDLQMMGVASVDQLPIFSAMDQSKGAGFFPRKEVSIENKTPSYITPLGKLPANSLTPNYMEPPSWVYSPEVDARSLPGQVNHGKAPAAPAKK
ncbi:MAG: cytochrome c3 family protein [Campylobacterales bacterium]